MKKASAHKVTLRMEIEFLDISEEAAQQRASSLSSHMATMLADAAYVRASVPSVYSEMSTVPLYEPE